LPNLGNVRLRRLKHLLTGKSSGRNGSIRRQLNIQTHPLRAVHSPGEQSLRIEKWIKSTLVNREGKWAAPSPHLHAAVHHDIDSRHVRTLVRCQEQRNICHLLGPPQTTEQRLAEHRARPFGIL